MNRLAGADLDDIDSGYHLESSNSKATPLRELAPGEEYFYIIDKIRKLYGTNIKPTKVVNKLLLLAPWFLHHKIGRFIKNYPRVIEKNLQLAQDRGDLDDRQFLGIVFAAVMTGGRPWDRIPQMLKNNAAKV